VLSLKGEGFDLVRPAGSRIPSPPIPRCFAFLGRPFFPLFYMRYGNLIVIFFMVVNVDVSVSGAGFLLLWAFHGFFGTVHDEFSRESECLDFPSLPFFSFSVRSSPVSPPPLGFEPARTYFHKSGVGDLTTLGFPGFLFFPNTQRVRCTPPPPLVQRSQ